MKAIVLVGGEGTRLRPLTLTTPKPMLPVVDVPMIERLIGHLVMHGVDHVVLSMGYRPDAFLSSFPEGSIAGATLEYAVEPEPLDTAGGIAFAARHSGIARGGETFLAANSDVLSDWDLTALIEFHRSRGAEGTVALTPVENPAAFGVVPTDDGGRVIAFIEPDDDVKKGLRQPSQPPPTNLINAGFYVLEPSVIARIPEGERIKIERATFPQMAAERTLYALGSDAYWLDTGTAALFLQANLDLVSGARGPLTKPAATQHNDGVWLSGGPVVDGTVESPAFVGEAAYVGAGAVVSRSVIGAGARVEAGAVVGGSVLLPGAFVHREAEVMDSIIGEEAEIGAGARVGGITVVQAGAVVDAGAVLDGERVHAGAR